MSKYLIIENGWISTSAILLLFGRFWAGWLFSIEEFFVWVLSGLAFIILFHSISVFGLIRFRCGGAVAVAVALRICFDV